MKHITILTLALAGCAGTAEQTAQRQLCDARALARAELDAAQHCPASTPWEECSEAERIEREFIAAMEACP